MVTTPAPGATLIAAAAGLRVLYDRLVDGDTPELGKPLGQFARDVIHDAARDHVRVALLQGLAIRQLASRARISGAWLIEHMPLETLADVAARHAAYEAEIAHLQRRITGLRAARARDARLLARTGVCSPGELANVFRVTVATLDKWIAAAAAAARPD